MGRRRRRRRRGKRRRRKRRGRRREIGRGRRRRRKSLSVYSCTLFSLPLYSLSFSIDRKICNHSNDISSYFVTMRGAVSKMKSIM